MAVNPSISPDRRLGLPWQSLLDAVMLLLWGTLLIRFSLTGQLYLLIHPDYAGLAYLALVILLGLGLGRLRQVWRTWRGLQPSPRSQEHNPLLPRQLTTGLLLAVAVFGLIYSPRPFNSQTAFQRGITDVLGQTRSRPQRFIVSTRPIDRTIVDWVHTLHVYPEPDAYTNQPARVTGFVTIMPGWPAHIFMITRFVLTCCAADAYPVGLAVELPTGILPPKPDSWLEVTGEITTVMLDGKRQVAIGSARLTPIPEPRTPYAY